MNFNSDQARALASLYAQERAVAVLDAQAERPNWWEIFPRTWAPEGVVILPSYAPPPSGPIVVLITPGGPPDWLDDHLFMLAPDQRFVVVAVEPSGALIRLGAPLPKVDAPTGHAIRLNVFGRNSLDLTLVALPVVFWTELSGSAAYRVLHVEASQDGQDLPSSSWFRIDARSGETRLELDVLPGRSDDVWTIRVDGREVGRPIPPPSPAPVRRVILVFDRTCPDADRWLDARALVRGDRSRGDTFQEFSDSKAPARGGPALDHQAELNAAVRRGVAEGLRAAFAEPVAIEMIWFADVPGDGLGQPAGVRMPSRAWGRGDSRVSSADTEPILNDATYMPGLDIWDALEEALAEAVRIVQDEGPCPILIVGNSPPRPPKDPHHPFTRLWRSGLSFATTRSRSDFPDMMGELANRGCPVATVFLTGHRTHEGGDEYRTNQRRVQEAFARTMPTITARATAAEVASGVVSAIQLFQQRVSSVDLREEQA